MAGSRHFAALSSFYFLERSSAHSCIHKKKCNTREAFVELEICSSA